ncbi:hypothetical protein BWI97_15710 [Siphonobacter sp. BAB-5405]|uniref:hypothetical protein n=1 Tax=Siphonobacter sp. BAB-5405 TaxID=1864825 RepID=UPI000C7FF41C|nr:hypothetical protein [Siphonobacter sp. BAB-5405]PMD94842.1 hypothetical protein BWI97_15710 [Siphonobacter sp. BAB-5405]
MKTIPMGGHSVAFYDSIFETPIAIYKLHERYAAAAAFTVDNLGNYNDRIASALNHLASGNTEAVETELRNMYFGLYQFLGGMDMSSMALLCLAAEVDGMPFRKRDEETLMKLRDKMSEWGFTAADADKLATDLKKNFKLSWTDLSPDGSE